MSSYFHKKRLCFHCHLSGRKASIPSAWCMFYDFNAHFLASPWDPLGSIKPYFHLMILMFFPKNLHFTSANWGFWLLNLTWVPSGTSLASPGPPWGILGISWEVSGIPFGSFFHFYLFVLCVFLFACHFDLFHVLFCFQISNVSCYFRLMFSFSYLSNTDRTFDTYVAVSTFPWSALFQDVVFSRNRAG